MAQPCPERCMPRHVRLPSRGGANMPRHNITPSALRQAETNPNAFLDAELEALYQALEKLFPSFSKEQVIEMVEKHKELHMLLEVYERSFTIVRRAYHNRRGPMLAQAKEQTRQ